MKVSLIYFVEEHRVGTCRHIHAESEDRVLLFLKLCFVSSSKPDGVARTCNPSTRTTEGVRTQQQEGEIVPQTRGHLMKKVLKTSRLETIGWDRSEILKLHTEYPGMVDW